MTLAYSADLDWRAAENVPFAIRTGVEVARHTAGKRPAALSLVCSAHGDLHLLLRTRLPPDDYRFTVRLGRDDDVWIYVGEGAKQSILVVADVVAKGRDAETLIDWVAGVDAADTIVTMPLSPEQLASLQRWFGNTPPTKVSVVGIGETGVYMVGTRSGEAIGALQNDCASEKR